MFMAIWPWAAAAPDVSGDGKAFWAELTLAVVAHANHPIASLSVRRRLQSIVALLQDKTHPRPQDVAGPRHRIGESGGSDAKRKLAIVPGCDGAWRNASEIDSTDEPWNKTLQSRDHRDN
jgi:hypothetical protein